MISIEEKGQCSGCSACYNICPKGAIVMQEDTEGFLYPFVDNSKCINCELCVKVCPIKKENKKVVSNIPAIACKNKEEKIREESSSGGVFTALCELVINQGGVVFGAIYDENLNVKHSYVENIYECNKFRGSKYVQSSIGDAFKKVKEFLVQGRLVMFSGTPCQVAGLYSYLGKEYDNLILIDLVCHGAPSPKVFRKYIKSLENKEQCKVRDISFRNKKNGWKKFTFKVTYDNRISSEIAFDNIYMKGFLSDLYLRPSCYKCNFKKNITYADLTLADYWGVDVIHPEFDDDRGTSLVLINSAKGKKYINDIVDKLEYIDTDYKQSVRYNPSIERASTFNDFNRRRKFFKKLNDEKDVERVINKYIKPSLIKKIINKLKKC